MTKAIMYKLLRPLLFKMDSETVHERTKSVVKAIQKSQKARKLTSALFSFDDPRLHTRLWDMEFQNPVGLAAGFDKNAEMFPMFQALGFAFVELGTVTYHPQDGNPKPRLFRLPEDQAIINRMGFNGQGAATVQKRIAGLPQGITKKIINIGKSKIVDNAEAVSDYMKTLQLLLPFADIVEVNVSSPNTPGLRELQGREALTEILQNIVSYKNNDVRTKKIPVLVKIAPDLAWTQIDNVIEVVKNVGLDGIVATNTTIERPEHLQSSHKTETGGLSGAPLKDKSTQVIRYIYEKTQGATPIIGVGGICTAEDAYEKIKAGASLVEVYTGMIYEGPSICKNICKGLVELVEKDGYKNIKEAVGTDAKS